MKPVLFLLIAAIASFASPDAPVANPLWHPWYIHARSGAQHLSLNGDWQLGYTDTAVSSLEQLAAVNHWIRTTVPSSVQWSLYRAGELPHPYERLNADRYAFAEQKVWYYRRSFAVPPNAAAHVLLCFEGADYYSRVWLNGKLMGRHEGMGGGPTVEVTRELRTGAQNDLVVEVRAGNFEAGAAWNFRRMGRVVRPSYIGRGLGTEGFFALGLWREVRLELLPDVHLERPFLVTRYADAEKAVLSLSAELFAQAAPLDSPLHPNGYAQLDQYGPAGADAAPLPGFSLRVELQGKDSNDAPYEVRDFPLDAFKGVNHVRRDIALRKPRLWWPNGLGPSPLYHVTVSLIRDNHVLDAIAFDHGIRTVERQPSAGPPTSVRWTDWQTVVNGRKFFVKGVNWTAVDVLLDESPFRYRWLLGLAHDAGIQMIRVNGAFTVECDEFYRICDELGILVEQDFPMANQEYPDWPQDVWEAQVVQNITRLRNHPSLALYSGGNEFNPYSVANSALSGIFERSVRLMDDSRAYLRTDPDQGAVHIYRDTDPAWYPRLLRLVPFVSETGMHSIPEARSMREVIDPEELVRPLRNMYSDEFARTHPEFRRHFVEFNPSRVPRMLSRASHIADISSPSLETLTEATQMGAGEFYQVVSDGLQAKFPVTTGLLPWVFQRPWPAVAIMLVDAFGQPSAPYYFLKRTYETTHAAMVLPRLLWGPGEEMPLDVAVLHAHPVSIDGTHVTVRVYDRHLKPIFSVTKPVAIRPGPSVNRVSAGFLAIPAAAADSFLFVVVELNDRDGRQLSRSVYWPRCLRSFEDPAMRSQWTASPQPWPTLVQGPWLKPQVSAARTQLALSVLSRTADSARIRVSNTGTLPAFPVQLEVDGGKRAFSATDNYFWLAPGEQRAIEVKILWRTKPEKLCLTITAWNAAAAKEAL